MSIKEKKLVYVAGPYRADTMEEIWDNLMNARAAGKLVYNMWLSKKRAKAVYDQILLRIGTPSESLTYIGEGLHNPPYDNTLPEGRSLNRTVTVSIEYEKEE